MRNTKISVFIFLIGFFSLLTLAGCSKSSPERKEFFNYINLKLEEIKGNETEAINAFDAIVSKDDYSYKDLLANLDENIIPKYTTFLSDLSSIELETEEIQTLNALYIEGTTLQLKAFQSLKTGIENRKQEELDLALDYIEQSKKKMQDFEDKAIELAEKYNIDHK